MIHYSLDTNIRKNVIVIIVLISTCITVVIDSTIVQVIQTYFASKTNLANTLYAFTFLKTSGLLIEFLIPGFFVWTILYCLYSKVIWKWKLLLKIHHLPDLNGEWDGELFKRDKDGKKTNSRKVKVSIKQDWDSIMVTTHLQDSDIPSFCECTVAAIDTLKGAPRLKYAYENKLNNHYIGYNELKIEDELIWGMYTTTKPSTGYFRIKLK